MAYGDNPGNRTPAKKPKKKIRAKAPSTTDRTSPNPSPPPKPKKGPPSPQRTGRATRPQPVTRERNAPPKRTDRTSDAKRTPEQKKRDKAASDANIREARIKVLRRRSRPLTDRLSVGGTIKVMTGGAAPAKKSKKPGLPGATIETLDKFGSPLGPQINRLVSKRSRPEDTTAPVMKALDLTARPAYAVSSAAKAKIRYIKKHGYKPFDSGARKAAVKGAERGLIGKEKTLGSDVLKELGVKNKAVRAVGGFAWDVATDPTRAGKVTRLSPKAHLERAARQEEAAAAKAAKGGRVKPARPKKAERHAKRAEKLRWKAETASEAPGIQIGSEGRHHRLMTSGRVTAKAGKAGSRVAERVGDSKAGQIVKGAVMPTARRKGETAAERDAFVYAERKRRARMNEAGRKGQRRGTAHARNVKDVDEKRIIARVEDPETLASPQVKRVADATTKELADLKTRQQQADVFEGEKPNYYPHQLEPSKGILRRKGRAASPGHAKRRKDDRPIHVQNPERAAEGKPLLSTKHGAIMGRYVTSAEKAIADTDYLKELKAAGKPLTAKSYDTMRDTDGLYRISGKSIQPVRHPSGRELDPGEVETLIKKGEDITILPRSRGDAEVSGRVGGKNEQTKATLRAVNKPMAVFKTAATVLNVPYYQIRNFMDDSFHAHAADTPLSAFPKATGLVKDLAFKERREGRQLTPKDIDGTVDVAGKEMPRSQFLKEAQEDGALRTGFFAGDDLTTGSSKPAAGARRIRPVQKVREWSQNVEDVPRLATYYAARDRGMTRKEASQHVRLYHFDYDELTDIERVIRATMVPFYTYARKNTPLMARLFFTRPGKLSAIEKLRQEFNKYGTDDNRYRAQVDKLRPLLDQAVKAGLISRQEVTNLYKGKFDSLLTDTDQRGLPFLGPNGSLQYMPLGVTDLSRVPFAFSWQHLMELPRRQFDLAMQMIGPQKLPLEMAQNYSFFFRDAIYRSADEPQAERWVTAPPWAGKAGFPTVRQKVDGKMVDAWPAWVDYSIRSLGPQAGMLATVGNPAKNSRGSTMGDLLTKQLTGVRRAKLDDRILAGIIARASKELGKIQVAKSDASDFPAVKSDDGFFFSKDYEALLDREKALTGLIENLRKARTGVAREKPKRLQRRPLTFEQQLRKELREDAEEMKNFGDELRRELERDAARSRIENAP